MSDYIINNLSIDLVNATYNKFKLVFITSRALIIFYDNIKS